MAETSRRKTFFILALAASLAVSLIAVVVKVMTDEVLREHMGETYYIMTLAMIGCVLLVLAGYVFDRTLMSRLKSLRTTVGADILDDGSGNGEPDHDEIIGLARNIERMAQALQKTEASYRGIVEDQVDLICRYRLDGKLTFVNSA